MIPDTVLNDDSAPHTHTDTHTHTTTGYSSDLFVARNITKFLSLNNFANCFGRTSHIQLNSPESWPSIQCATVGPLQPHLSR